MNFAEKQTYYDLLEIGPDSTPQEIRTAYLRVKSAYKKDSPALYTMMGEMDTSTLLDDIEKAYQVLSNPDRRKEYDSSHGFLSAEIVEEKKVVSIDRVPPMEDSRNHPEILVAPSTDFGASPPPPVHSNNPSAPGAYATEMIEEIAIETEWKGTTLRRLREAKRVTLEELAEYTKISRTYISAIEDENFAKLPAPVFLRGFVTQIAKYLKLPHEKVAAAYMARRNAVQT